MKNIRLIFLLLFSSSSALFGQSQTGMMYEQEALFRMSSRVWNDNYEGGRSEYNADFSKNPLIFENWHFGKLIFRDGTKIDSVQINIDTKLNSLMVRPGGNIALVAVRSTEVAEFFLYDTYDQYRFIQKTFRDFENVKDQLMFLQVLSGEDKEGSHTVLKRHVKEFISADRGVTYGGEVAADKFEMEYHYYYSSGSAPYKRFFLSKKSITNIIGKSKAKTVQAYVKQNKLKWNREADMVQILDEFL